ncbi:MAG: response regulator transcription factor [Anaerolineales bacterium]|nr:response regulator transcription factor [Anaerolineales bacterium]
MIRVLIVDDHDMLREGLISFLKAYPEFELVGEASSGKEAIELCLRLEPDVVLMDLLMPEMDGITAIRHIHHTQPNIRLIALSSFGEEDLIKGALEAGATSYLLKNVSAQELADAIRSTHLGLQTFSPEVASSLLRISKTPHKEALLEPLTSRERQILELMVAGLNNHAIAEKLNISKFTVKNHISNILGKLGVKNRLEAVKIAVEKGLVHLG